MPRLNEFFKFYPLHNRWLRRLEDPESTWAFTQDCIGISNVDHLSRSLDKTGIRHACVLALEPYVKSDWVIDQAKKEPRIIPVLSVHPDDNAKAEKINEYVRRGCRVLKLHPLIQDFSPRSKGVFDLIEAIQPHRIPVLCHTGCFSIPHLQKRKDQAGIENFVPLIRQFPSVSFIMCHMNLFSPDEAIAVAARFENVCLETSWQTPKNIRRAIGAVGSSRIVFGSDWPYAFQSTSLAAVRAACRDEESLQEILGGNARRLLNFS